MINITEKFFEVEFKDESSKQAYLQACKWLATNMVSKVEVGILYKIVKKIDADLPTFKVELYCSLELSKLKKEFCTRCKEFHKSFYINQEYNCNACKLKAFLVGSSQKLGIKRSYNKERLSYLLDGE